MKKLHFLFVLTCLMLLSACNNAQRAHHSDKTENFIVTPEGDTIEKVVKSPSEWKEELTDMEYYVLREAGTERAFTGKYVDNKKEGIYLCKACGFELFDSATKFKSGTGWPSFYEPLNSYCIAEEKDSSLGMVRTEVLCARCNSHLGHVFNDGPEPTGLRYCINSVALDFKE